MKLYYCSLQIIRNGNRSGPPCSWFTGSPREGWETRDKVVEHFVICQKHPLEIFVWSRGWQTWTCKRRREDLLHYRERVLGQQIRLGTKRQGVLELCLLCSRDCRGSPLRLWIRECCFLLILFYFFLNIS